MDNYEKQVYTGRELFLKYNQDKLIEKYGLKHDEEYLYLKYIETEYRINRRNGAIEYATGEEWTDCREYTVVMTIYDFLCCSGQEILPPLTGQWQPEQVCNCRKQSVNSPLCGKVCKSIFRQSGRGKAGLYLSGRKADETFGWGRSDI